MKAKMAEVMSARSTILQAVVSLTAVSVRVSRPPLARAYTAALLVNNVQWLTTPGPPRARLVRTRTVRLTLRGTADPVASQATADPNVSAGIFAITERKTARWLP